MKYYVKSCTIPEIAIKALEHKLECEYHPILNEEGFPVKWKNFSEITSYHLVQGLGGEVKNAYDEWYANHRSMRRSVKTSKLNADSVRVGEFGVFTNSAGLEKELKAKRAEAFENEMFNYFLKGILRRLKLEVGSEVLTKAFDDELASSPGISEMSRNMPQILNELRATLNATLGEEIKGEDF